MSESALAVTPLRYGPLSPRVVETDNSPRGRLVRALCDLPSEFETLGDAVKASLSTIDDPPRSDGEKATARRFLHAFFDVLNDRCSIDKYRNELVDFVCSYFDPHIVAATQCLSIAVRNGDVDRTRAALQRATAVTSAKERALEAANSAEVWQRILDLEYRGFCAMRLDGNREAPPAAPNGEFKRYDLELTPTQKQLFPYWYAQEEITKAAARIVGDRQKGGRPRVWGVLEAMILMNESSPADQRLSDDELLGKYGGNFKGKSMGDGKRYPAATLADLQRVRRRLLSVEPVSDDTPSD